MTLGSVVVCKMRSLAVTQYGKSAFHIKHKGMKAMEKKKVMLLLWLMTIKEKWLMTDALQIANGNK